MDFVICCHGDPVCDLGIFVVWRAVLSQDDPCSDRPPDHFLDHSFCIKTPGCDGGKAKEKNSLADNPAAYCSRPVHVSVLADISGIVGTGDHRLKGSKYGQGNTG